MKNIVIATGNAHKVEEFNRLAEAANLHDVKFFSAKEVVPAGMPQVVEDSGTFIGNARLKARALRKSVPADYIVMADDSGLCVDALGGLPGVETAYYAGANATAEQNREKLLSALKGVPVEKRGAHFVCVLLVIFPDNSELIFEGMCEGKISEKESDSGFGFGYDPLFVPAGFDKTFAELDGNTKDALSHRGIAFKKLSENFRK